MPDDLKADIIRDEHQDQNRRKLTVVKKKSKKLTKKNVKDNSGDEDSNSDRSDDENVSKRKTGRSQPKKKKGCNIF